MPQTYTGARLRQTLDWALSSVGDDVTAYVAKLTDMEQRLYRQAAVAAANHHTWKLYANQRWLPTAAAAQTTAAASVRTVSPPADGDDDAAPHHRDKRKRPR